MTRLFLKRTLNGWTEADDTSKAGARKFEVGKTYRAEIVRPRSLKSLHRYWALVQLILDNTDQFKSKEQLHDYLKIRAGHCTPIVAKSTGETFLVANSIDFDTLDESAFAEVWSRIINVVCEDILPGISQDELVLEVQKLCGLAA